MQIKDLTGFYVSSRGASSVLIGKVDGLTPTGEYLILEEDGYLRAVGSLRGMRIHQELIPGIKDDDEEEDEEESKESPDVPVFRKGMRLGAESVAGLIREFGPLTQQQIAEYGCWDYEKNVSSRMTDANLLTKIRNLYGDVVAVGKSDSKGLKTYHWVGA